MTAPRTPIPLAPSARAIRDHRYHVYVNGPRNERGAYPAIAEARFATIEHARTWADNEHPTAAVVRIDFLSARTGWRERTVAMRTDAGWGR